MDCCCTVPWPAGLKSTKFVMDSLCVEKVGVQGVRTVFIPGMLSECDLSRACIMLSLQRFFIFNADPDPDFHFNADPDPAPLESDGNLRPLIYRPLGLHMEPPGPHCERPRPIWASKAFEFWL